ncbi:peptidase S8/S53 domain-containing protein [Lactarius hengduanensis]|nr:peptidase S8/S53 domain-containing protein [Lactarius hengduanensis]
MDIQYAEAMAYPAPRIFYSAGCGRQMQRMCNLFGQLGLRGASVLFPSGNHGAGQGNCVIRDGSVQFGLTFPRNLAGPWVTVVGGTTGHQPEVTASFSGGGFSEYFEHPKYQKQAVSTFLQDLGSGYQGLYNASGRGIPGISAQAVVF